MWFVHPAGHLFLPPCTLALLCIRRGTVVLPLLRRTLVLFFPVPVSLPVPLPPRTLLLATVVPLLRGRRRVGAKDAAVRDERAAALFGPFSACLGGALRRDEHPVLLVEPVAIQQRLAHRVQRSVAVGAPPCAAEERRRSPRAVDALRAPRSVALLCVGELGSS